MSNKELIDALLRPSLELMGAPKESNNSEEYRKLLDSIVSATKQRQLVLAKH